jgi:hypothetical protein
MLPEVVLTFAIWLAYLCVAGAAGYLLVTLVRDWVGRRLW